MSAEPITEESKEEWQRFKAAFCKSKIERRHWLYTRTLNPIHAFHAYRMARAAKIDPPAWILELFDRWAEELCVKRPKGAKPIADALGLGSKAGPSTILRAETEARDLWIVERVFWLREFAPERNKLDIFGQVAEEFNLSSDRVQSIWYDHTRGVKH